MLSSSNLHYQTSFLLLTYVNAYKAISINGNQKPIWIRLFKQSDKKKQYEIMMYIVITFFKGIYLIQCSIKEYVDSYWKG